MSCKILMLFSVWRNSIITAIFVLHSFTAYSQKKHDDNLLNGLAVEAHFNTGIIYPHDKSIEQIIDGNIYSFELALTTQSKERHFWEKLFRNPDYGLAYNYTYLGNPEVLGNAHTLYTFIRLPVNKPANKLNIAYQLGMGAAYISEKYDIKKNSLNRAISTDLNIYLNFDVLSVYKLNERNNINAAIVFSHYSNGKVRSPNLGINSVGISMGWSYILRAGNKSERSFCNEPRLLDYKKHFWELIASAGAKRDDMMNERIYPISTISLGYNYAFTPKYAIGAGLDGFFDKSVAPTHYFENKHSHSSDNFQLGLHTSIRARYGKLIVLVNMGRYLVSGYTKYGKVYARVGMRYAVSKNILFNFTIKSHYTTADYMEWGVGYRLKTKGD